MAFPSDEVPSPEKQLLICCARTRLPAPVQERIRQLLHSPIDWDLLLEQARSHSVTPLVCRQLPLVASDLLDPAQLNRLKEMGRGYALRSLILSAELVTILDLFRSEGLQAIPYKGPVLAVQAFEDVSLREFEDLDIIMRQQDIAKADKIVTGLGYRARFPGLVSADMTGSLAPGEYHYRDPSRRLMVELHTERTLRHFPVPVDIDELATRLVAVSVGGHDLQTFSPEDTFLLLAIHGSKHFWEQLSWIADLAAFAEVHPHLDWSQVFGRAQRIRAHRIVAVSLALAFRLFHPPSKEVAARVESDPVASLIASRIERRLFARVPRQLGALARFRLRRQMIESPFEGWRYSLRLATQPSEDDWSAMPLPPGLAPLYFALRPLRLLCRYGVSDTTSSSGSMAGKNASN